MRPCSSSRCARSYIYIYIQARTRIIHGVRVHARKLAAGNRESVMNPGREEQCGAHEQLSHRIKDAEVVCVSAIRAFFVDAARKVSRDGLEIKRGGVVKRRRRGLFLQNDAGLYPASDYLPQRRSEIFPVPPPLPPPLASRGYSTFPTPTTLRSVAQRLARWPAFISGRRIFRTKSLV